MHVALGYAAGMGGVFGVLAFTEVDCIFGIRLQLGAE